MTSTKSRDDRIYKNNKFKKKSMERDVNKFNVIEAYKSLRTNIQFILNHEHSNVITVTSTLPRDGKSTVVSNLGVAFAQINIKVLIIDCDMRKPRINKFFDISVAPGLSNYLARLAPLDKVIQKTGYENLSIISSGTLPPNPAELLSNKEMHDFVNELRNDFDLILLDTPPIGIVSDAYVTTRYSDGVILVVKHMSTTFPMVERCLSGLKLVDAKLLGVVMNAVNYEKVYGKKYGKFGYDKYGYGYGKNSIENYDKSPSNSSGAFRE